MAPGRKIGLFGGTFDPIHNAHLTVAREAAAQAALDEILFVPAAHPPHKSLAGITPYEHRLRMVELACQGEPDFVASRLEEGEGKSYSILTIRKLRGMLRPDDTICFLIGADAFAELATWKDWKEVAREVEFVVVTRPGHKYAIPPGVRLHSLETLALPVSSSDIRTRLAAGGEVRELPGPVSQYIREHGLYR